MTNSLNNFVNFSPIIMSLITVLTPLALFYFFSEDAFPFFVKFLYFLFYGVDFLLIILYSMGYGNYFLGLISCIEILDIWTAILLLLIFDTYKNKVDATSLFCILIIVIIIIISLLYMYTRLKTENIIEVKFIDKIISKLYNIDVSSRISGIIQNDLFIAIFGGTLATILGQLLYDKIKQKK